MGLPPLPVAPPPVLTTATTPAQARVLLVINERIKLIAGFLNSIGVLFVAYGVVAYVVRRDVSGDTSSLWIFVWAAAGVGLCGAGCKVLKELRT
jgi:hypothetical protein